MSGVLGILASYGAAATSYDTDAQAYFDQVVTNGGAALSSAWKTKINTLVVQLKADGNWTTVERLHLFYNENAIAALTSLKNPSQAMAVAVNSPTFTASTGYTFNGSTNYIRSSFTPSTASIYSQNSACEFFEATTRPSGTYVDCGASDGTTRSFLEVETSGTYYAACNSGSSAFISGSNASSLAARYAYKRTGSTSFTFYKNGSGTSGSDNSGTPGIKEHYIGAYNNNGTAQYHAPDVITYWGVGNGSINISALETALLACR